MTDEGYIKFRSRWKQGPPPRLPGLDELIRVRDRLFDLGLIGVYPDSGIGFGNVSLRVTEGTFIISGTRTGGIPRLGPAHFTSVTLADIPRNTVHCHGPVEASSESMTHAMLYACEPSIRSVLHVHHRGMWEALPGKVPLSDPEVPYGTPAMAREVRRLFKVTDLARQRILVMGGHEEGMIAFGDSPGAAEEVIRRHLPDGEDRGGRGQV